MTVRFIIGRAGSGKSWQCDEQVRAELAGGNLASRLIFLTPEQSTFQIEQAVLRDGQVRGYNNLEVTSFVRLAKKATQDMPVNALRVLSKTARHMMLYRLLRNTQSSLRIFKGEITPGFCDQIGQFLSELRRYNKKPDDLLAQAETLLAKEQDNLLPLAEKLKDLSVIQKFWQEMLHEKYLDPEEYLDYLAEYYQARNLPGDTKIWIDGFAGFTPQQYKVLTLMMKQARQCNICLNLDTSMDEFQQASSQNHALDQTNIFHPTLESYQRLVNLCVTEGIGLEPAIILPGTNKVMPRFAGSKTLANIEEFVFSDRRPVGPATDVDKTLDIVQAPNQAQEIRAVARRIVALCRDEGLRYNQIAVITRDLSGMEETISSTLEEYHIPFFMDAGRSVRHHPLIRLVRAAFDLLTDNFRIDAIFDYIKTDLVPLTRPQADALENYCITTGVFGSNWLSPEAWRQQTPEFREGDRKYRNQFSVNELDQLRRLAIAPLLAMKNNITAAGKEQGVRIITGELMKLLDNLKATEKLAEWQAEAEKSGDLENQEIHSQVYSDFIDILNDLVSALDNFPITLREYNDILFTALDEMTLRLVPPSLDQVLVGTIERSRQPEIKAAFILGMNDCVFPRHSSSTAILTDRQREILAGDNFEVAPAAGIKLLHEKYLAYIAFTRPTQYLWVSYCASDSSDKVLNESPFIKDLRRASGKTTTTLISDSRGSASVERITNREQLALELTAALSDARNIGKLEPFWRELYLHAGPESLPQIARDGLTANNQSRISQEMAGKIIGSGQIRTSISRIEEYSKCPFRYFCRYMLKLNEREPFGLQAVDMGSYYHAVLCQEFRELQRQGKNWHELEEEDIPELVEKASAVVCREDEQVVELIEKTHRNGFLFARARQDLVKLSVTLCRAAKVSGFRQQEAELEFGKEGQSMPGLHISLPGAFQMILTGKIDRIDTMMGKTGCKVAIYDYKLSSRKFNWVKFYSGLELQLASYLLVATEQYEGGNNEPAGMFFMETRPAVISSKQPKPVRADNEEEPMKGSGTKFDGLLNTDLLAEFESDLTDGYSKYYASLRKNQSGEIKGSSSATNETLKAIIGYARHILTSIATNITQGKIDIMPYRHKTEIACNNCPYRSVCQFDQTTNQYRDIENLDAETVKLKIDKNSRMF